LREHPARKRSRSRPGAATKRAASRGKGLRVSVSSGVGFCSGVKRAIKIALEAAGRSPRGIYSFGPVIHNPQAVERLRGLGVKPLVRLGGQGGTLVVRSHGAAPRDLERARRRGFTVVDATCPIVRKAQENARRLHELGYEVVIVGEHHHPEVKSLRGFVPGRSIVVEDAKDAKVLKFGRRVGIIAQTTIPVDTFADVVGLIARRAREVLVFNTVCSETARRLERARDLAGRVDVLVVVGGRNSANTTRLASLCRSICASTHHIETAEELDAGWFARGSEVGVVTGASTPRWLVNSVVNRLEKL
jgi:(E)-4-hydroxy-3-methyl-but-2-enyl pyrophosphate reductase